MHLILLIFNKTNQSVEIGGIIKNTIGFSTFLSELLLDFIHFYPEYYWFFDVSNKFPWCSAAKFL